MPYLGLPSFLPGVPDQRRSQIGRVNALTRAILISTKISSNSLFKSCVNALTRAILISTLEVVNEQKTIFTCVNALTRAILISTGMNEIQENLTEGVNALTRAILISTLPLWNRLFKPLSGPVSARIFQNILKNSPDRGQKWAEGKLYFSEYNLQGIL